MHAHKHKLTIPLASSGLYQGYSRGVALTAKCLILVIVLWALSDTQRAEASLQALQNWSFQQLGHYYTYAVAFFAFVCLLAALHPRWGRIRLGQTGDKPEFSNLSWFSMMFGAGIGIGMLGYAAGEPLYHLQNNPDIIASHAQILAALQQANITVPSTNSAELFAQYQRAVAQGQLAPIPNLVQPKSTSALPSVYQYTFLHWGLGAWACYALVGLVLAFAGYTHHQPLTIRSGVATLLGKRLEGMGGNLVDIAAVLATVLGVAQTVGLGLSSFASGLYNITQADWLMTNTPTPEPTNAALLCALAVIMSLSMLSALSGVTRGIKWLSNLNILLSILLLGLFVVFGATWFSLELLGNGLFHYILRLPALSFQVWDNGTPRGQWQASWSIFYWAWWIAFSPFVGLFLAQISKNRSIREYVLGAIIAPAFMCFIWFAVVGGTAIDLTFTHAQGDSIFASTLTHQIYAVINLLFTPPVALGLSVIVVVLLLTYLVTSVDSALLVINTISAGGSHTPNTNRERHIILWGILLTAIIGSLLWVGGLSAIKAAMIVGAIPFSMLMILMGVGLLLALTREGKDST